MSRAYARIALLSAAFALGTYAFGWWTVPALALVWGRIGSGQRVREAAVAASIGWAALLLLGARQNGLGNVGSRLAGVMHLPLWALLVVTLLFPLVLAWSAARLASPD